MTKPNFITFDEFVTTIRTEYQSSLEGEVRRKKIVLKLRAINMEGLAPRECEVGAPPEIPNAPETNIIRPYSRVELLSRARQVCDAGPSRFDSNWMVVYTMCGSSIEGYLYDSWAYGCGRVTVDMNQVFECLPPLKPNQADPLCERWPGDDWRDVVRIDEDLPF